MTIESIEETDPVEPAAPEPAKESHEAKRERKLAAQKKKRVMESCLTLTRSFYGDQEQMVSDFMEMHPTQNK